MLKIKKILVCCAKYRAVALNKVKIIDPHQHGKNNLSLLPEDAVVVANCSHDC